MVAFQVAVSELVLHQKDLPVLPLFANIVLALHLLGLTASQDLSEFQLPWTFVRKPG
jgi:hypothetical protein